MLLLDQQNNRELKTYDFQNIASSLEMDLVTVSALLKTIVFAAWFLQKRNYHSSQSNTDLQLLYIRPKLAQMIIIRIKFHFLARPLIMLYSLA